MSDKRFRAKALLIDISVYGEKRTKRDALVLDICRPWLCPFLMPALKGKEASELCLKLGLLMRFVVEFKLDKKSEKNVIRQNDNGNFA